MNPFALLGDIFNIAFFGPVVNLLVLILRGFEIVHIPGALGLSIIILTVFIRVLLWPLMSSQLKSAKKMAELKPHLDTLKEKHKDDKQALAQAQMALYKEHGVNPAGGCLPSLIQIPIIIALYQTILSMFGGNAGLDRINHSLYLPAWHLGHAPDLGFLGFSLAAKPSEFAQVGILVLLVPVITAVLQLMQSMMMAPAKPLQEHSADSAKEKQEKEGAADAMASMQGQMMYMMPLMIGYFAFTFPIGLAIYWNTFTVLGIIQQYKISGWGKLSVWFNKIKR